MNDNGLAATQRSAGQRSGDHGADAAQGEHAVHRQARLADVPWQGSLAQNPGQSCLQLIETATADHRGGNNRRLGERRSRELFAELGRDCLFIHGQVNLRESDDGPADVEIAQNLQMFLGLGHPTVVGGHHKQGQVNRADTGHHVLHEILVAGDIDDAQVNR